MHLSSKAASKELSYGTEHTHHNGGEKWRRGTEHLEHLPVPLQAVLLQWIIAANKRSEDNKVGN